ncbi:hypothetical protein [Legionella waltersii]|uniref:Uncharacterized protein n=1 Tax=Legionella waltersii TaxID=66969 RepID=A0A0W1AC10_9GAMM|nr:hypothetical protein [Legionella waltersii]KTD78804.1 hypothetical protein Lwal_1574 [Legionella waltersii]SNV11057.1 Uncharacterised protein [Legionella waltersii]
MSNENIESVATPSQEELNQAMNTIGQQLFQSLSESVQKLPQPLRKGKIVNQALAAFLTNVIYRQFPEDKQARELTIDQLLAFVKQHLAQI